MAEEKDTVEFKIKLSGRELTILCMLATIFVTEFLALMLMVYFERVPIFIELFVKSLKVASPVFFGINIIFLISTIFVRGTKFIMQSWTTYLQEIIRFSALSFAITIVLITLSSILGALLEFVLRHVFGVSSIESMINYLREWVRVSFH